MAIQRPPFGPIRDRLHQQSAEDYISCPTRVSLSGINDAESRQHAPALPARRFRRIRVHRTYLRIHLDALPQAVPRTRGLRADIGARDLHGRNGPRFLAGVALLWA